MSKSKDGKKVQLICHSKSRSIDVAGESLELLETEERGIGCFNPACATHGKENEMWSDGGIQRDTLGEIRHTC
jgi:hypothetical protein